jgi:catechol 2,3-dioxygenase-like lactoylglutathione lyase family enzyme
VSDEAFPIVVVDDIAATRRFYERLGFTVGFQFPPDGEPGFVTMTRGSSTIGFGAGRTGGDDFGYWVYVPDVDVAVAELRAAGVPVEGPPEDQPWGERVARVRDPDGRLVYLGAPQ